MLWYVLFSIAAAVVFAWVAYLLGYQKGLRAGDSFTDAAESDEWRHEAETVVQQRIQDRLERVLEATRRHGRITNDEVEEMFCIGDRTASRYLRLLTEAGRLIRRGSGRATYYEPVETE